jgi:NAD(P)-dependent dehydrogenase (short-subunit alcohol dehydrogenase family)
MLLQPLDAHQVQFRELTFFHRRHTGAVKQEKDMNANTKAQDAQNTEVATGALAGKTALIFGGTSGIGLDAALQAERSGAEVIVVGRSADTAERVAAQHGFAGWRAADVTDAHALQQAVSDLPKVDHLVLLAGTLRRGDGARGDVAHLRNAFEERIWAAVHVIRALGDRLAPMTRSRSSRAVSPTVRKPTAPRCLRRHRPRWKRLHAAWRSNWRQCVSTHFRPVRSTRRFSARRSATRDAVVANMEKTLPLHRLGTASEAGAGVVFLMTNGFMNGATLNVDGGARLV